MKLAETDCFISNSLLQEADEFMLQPKGKYEA